MKNSILIIAIISSLVSSNCQTYVSFRTGGNYSLICSKTTGYTNEFESKFSYEIGTNLTRNLVRDFDISFELDYIDYATSVYSEGFSPAHYREYCYDLRLGYISISLLPEYSLGNKRSLFINIGPYLSILTNSKMDGTLEGHFPNDVSIDEELTGSANDYFKNIDFGLLTSFGFRLKITDKLFILPQIRYSYGFYDIGDDYFETYNMSNYIRGISFLIDLEYNIK